MKNVLFSLIIIHKEIVMAYSIVCSRFQTPLFQTVKWLIHIEVSYVYFYSILHGAAHTRVTVTAIEKVRACEACPFTSPGN